MLRHLEDVRKVAGVPLLHVSGTRHAGCGGKITAYCTLIPLEHGMLATPNTNRSFATWEYSN